MNCAHRIISPNSLKKIGRDKFQCLNCQKLFTLENREFNNFSKKLANIMLQNKDSLSSKTDGELKLEWAKEVLNNVELTN